MINILKKMLGLKTNNIKEAKRIVHKINELEQKYEELNDDELRDKIRFYKNYIKKDNKRNNKLLKNNRLLINVFAIVRESSKRVFNKRHYDVQLLGGIYLNESYISEMQTGEGKTLVATCPAVYNAILGKKVHIITVNDYLATRDFKQMGQLYSFLGLSTGLIVSNLSKEDRKLSYKCDIVYGTNNEFGFDYLRDNMLADNEEPVQQGLDYVIIDEVDSVLIDEARTPLIISAPATDNSLMYKQMSDIVSSFQENIDFKRDKENKKLLVGTEKGIKKAEEYFMIDNLFSIENSILLNSFNQALKAHFIFQKDKDYVVKNNEILIVDNFTGRLMTGRRYADGLHQAIEAKENVPLKKESKTVATITFQNFFRLYKKISGMTGTAKTEEDEFYSIYGLPVIQIPKNKLEKRIDLPDVIFRSKKAKYKAVIEKIKECYGRKQPILVGTTSISTSEYLSDLLKKENIPHNVLNAKYDDKEAEIISHAGQLGAITIATNMAGRGTDIITEDGVNELGGLYILGTEKHESRRIDNQLKGRTARQGANGITEFYISLDDDIFKYFGGEKLLSLFEHFKIDIDDTPINSKYLTKAVNKCQKRIETRNFDIRKNLLNYDDVLNKQRKIIYNQRNEIRTSNYDYLINNLTLFVKDYIKETYLNKYASPDSYPDEWDLEGLLESFYNQFKLIDFIDINELKNLNKDELDEFVINRFISVIKFKEKILGTEMMATVLRSILLKIKDELWTDHINNMSILQEGIGLRAYGQLNPLIEYKKEAYDMFIEMSEQIKEKFVLFSICFQIKIDNKLNDK